MTQVLFAFRHPDGKPLAGAGFTIQMRRPGMIPGGGGVIVPESLSFVTNEDGTAIAELQPSTSVYLLVLADGGDACSGIRYKFYVPESSAIIDAEDLYLAPPPNSEPWDETAIQMLTDAKAAAIAAAAQAGDYAAEAQISAVSAAAAAERAATAVEGVDLDVERAERARDASEAYAIDALAARTGTNADRIAAQQAAADASSAVGVQIETMKGVLSGPAGGAEIGIKQIGAGAVTRTDLAKHNERVSVTDYGALKNRPDNNVSLAIQQALAVHAEVILPAGDWYGGPASAADEHLVVKLTRGKKVIFEEGARFFFGQTGDTYLPPFAVVNQGKSDVHFVRPHFVWTGQIRWSEAGDLQYAIPDPISPSVARLGQSYAYAAYIYNCAISILSSHSVTIDDMKFESLDPLKPCLQAISSARTDGGPITVNGIDLNDTNVGILAQGGKELRVTRIRQGRSNQDIGIPGHAVYAFTDDLFIDDVIDNGDETGLLRTSSHTISYKGGGTCTINNINTRRAYGLLGYGTQTGRAEKIQLSNAIWDDREDVPINGAKIGAIFNAGGADNNDHHLQLSNVVMSTDRDRVILGGAIKNATGDLTICRKDMAATVEPYLYGRFTGCDLKMKLVQRGTFDAALIGVQPGGATLQSGNTFRISLDGFNSQPTLNYAENDGRWASNKIIIDLPKVRRDGTANPERTLGDPSIMMTNTSVFTKGQNFIGLTDDTAVWSKSFPAGSATINADFPLVGATHIVELFISAANGAWRRLYRYMVSTYRPGGVGTPMYSIQPLGTPVLIGGGIFVGELPTVTVVDMYNMNVAFSVTNATALASPIQLYVSSTRIAH